MIPKYNLRKRRKELKMTLEQVAAKAGITPGAVRAYEVGAIRGKLETRQKLADALGISILLLMTKDEKKASGNLYQIQEFCEEKKMTPDEVWAELKRLGRG
jgi:transcriptional regulator with XRE-family HTH domain